MNTHPTIVSTGLLRTGRRFMLAAAAGVAVGAGIGFVGGCESDDAVGHTKTTEKRVIDTPTQKTTITETHEKDTKIVR